jgi:hypothetical protein
MNREDRNNQTNEFERIKEKGDYKIMNFYYSYDEDGDDDRLGKNDDWKISFYNHYKPCDFCKEIFLKSDLIYVTTNNDDLENIVETLRLCAECLTVINHDHDERIFNKRK